MGPEPSAALSERVATPIGAKGTPGRWLAGGVA